MTCAITKIRMADFYRFFAMAMDYPQTDWMNSRFFDFIFGLLKELCWKTDHENVTNFIIKNSDSIDLLQLDHTRLFINGVPHVIAPPYASVYLSNSGQLYGPSTERTKVFYSERGYTLKSDQDIPDHLTYELEFLALLNERNRTDDEEFFLQKLFHPWFPTFRDRVMKGAQYPYYPIIVKLIDHFTKEEPKCL